MTPIGTWLHTLFHGKRVGEDAFGNRYFVARAKPKNAKAKRWVLYKGIAEASKIPPMWHAWLHYTVDDVPNSEANAPAYAWQKPHIPNLTGTELRYVPKGHVLRGGRRAESTADYQAWSPASNQPNDAA